MKQVEIRVTIGDIDHIRQPGHRVFGGEPGDVVSRLDGTPDRCGRKVGGGGVAAPLPQVHRHPQRLIAVALDVFQLPLAHAHTQARTL